MRTVICLACCCPVLCYAEGKVGVSAMCILGYNVNNGQEISLRLRTDDYAGFRKYLAIRRTLVHELTHNVSIQGCVPVLGRLWAATLLCLLAQGRFLS